MELNDEGAELLASTCRLLRGPGGAAMTPNQCRFVDLDFITSFWLVRWLRKFGLRSGSACHQLRLKTPGFHERAHSAPNAGWWRPVQSVIAVSYGLQ